MKGRAIGTAIFCLVVLGAYAMANAMALDPFATSSDTRELPPPHTGGNTAGGVFWYGGFSGGK